MKTIQVLIIAETALLFAGCYATSSESKYTTETAKAIIDGSNNVCITIFLGAVMRAFLNK